MEQLSGGEDDLNPGHPTPEANASGPMDLSRLALLKSRMPREFSTLVKVWQNHQLQFHT